MSFWTRREHEALQHELEKSKRQVASLERYAEERRGLEHLLAQEKAAVSQLRDELQKAEAKAQPAAGEAGPASEAVSRAELEQIFKKVLYYASRWVAGH